MKKILSDGLILRSLSEGVKSDHDNLPQFYVDVFSGEGDEDAEVILPFAQDLISDKHPNMTLDDVWVVVDPSADEQIVSALLLIPQTWAYDGIEFGLGRVELVATHKDYRRRGYVRALMDVAHERSKALGHQVQGITGIGYYYRQFGYAMAINLGSDAHLPMAAIPKLKPDQEAQYTLRPATSEDIPAIQAWTAYEQRNGGITVKREVENWEFDIDHRQAGSPLSVNIQIVVNGDGQDVGYVVFVLSHFYNNIDVWQLIIGDQSSYYDTFYDVMRAIQSQADDYYKTLPDDRYPNKVRFESSVSPDIKHLVSITYGGLKRERVYTWYIRVEDIPQFIKHIAPVLEQRLQGSGMNRFTGELKISFFKLNGIKITLEEGRITDVVAVELKQYEGDMGLPYETFLNIVFGHRNWREIAHILPETYSNPKADFLIRTLFPAMRARVGEGIG